MTARAWPQRALWLVFVLAAADAFIPFAPFMPRAHLDASWMYALNQAVSQGLSFGRDVVFTFGPYASVFTKMFDPATVGRMFAGSVYLAAVYVACFHYLARDASARTGASVCAILALSLSGSDSLLLSLPLLVGLAVFKLARQEQTAPKSGSARSFGIALALGSFGLLPLIKGTLLLLCALVAALCVVYLLARRSWGLAALCAASPPVALTLLWLGAGESASALPNYFVGMQPIVSGYSEAMAIDGPARELPLFLVPAILALAALATQKRLPLVDRLFLLSLYGAFLFVSFKAGFVRHDPVHACVALSCLLASISFLFLVVPPRQIASRALLISLIATTAVSSAYLVVRSVRDPGVIPGVMPNPLVPRALAWDSRSWVEQFEAAKRKVSDECALDFDIQGSVDIYSIDHGCLIANGLEWKPRPVMQSYAVFTESLARLNETHVRGADAPDNLVFKLRTIDNRLPSLDDGLSLPAILDNYDLTATRGQWLLLTKKPMARSSSRYEPLTSLTARMGEDIPVPASSPLLAEISVRPTFLGRLASLLYKPSRLSLQVTLVSGEAIAYRVNSATMATGFFLSPLLATNQDFAALFAEAQGTPANHAVGSVRLVSSSALPLWQQEYTLTFKRYLH